MPNKQEDILDITAALGYPLKPKPAQLSRARKHDMDAVVDTRSADEKRKIRNKLREFLEKS